MRPKTKLKKALFYGFSKGTLEKVLRKARARQKSTDAGEIRIKVSGTHDVMSKHVAELLLAGELLFHEVVSRADKFDVKSFTEEIGGDKDGTLEKQREDIEEWFEGKFGISADGEEEDDEETDEGYDEEDDDDDFEEEEGEEVDDEYEESEDDEADDYPDDSDEFYEWEAEVDFDRDIVGVSNIEDFLEFLRNSSDNEIRGAGYRLPKVAAGDHLPLMLHQEATMKHIAENQFSSGIVHLPTGSGKTRLAIELMAQILKREPSTRFIWATDSTTLVRQSMIRLVELLERFQTNVCIRWLRQFKKIDLLQDMFGHTDVVFVTRDTLTKWLGAACGGRRTSEPLRNALTSRSGSKMAHPIVLFYDECHELGATGLQKAIRKFYSQIIERGRTARDRFSIYGLSATPMPTSTDKHRLLQEKIFPLKPGTKSAREEWDVLVHHSESMSNLVETKVLCPINLNIQHSGRFNIPPRLLAAASGDDLSRLHRKPRGMTDKQWVNEFSRQFNRTVMTHPDILEFIGDRIAEAITSLGKTLVFCASIEAANQLVEVLCRKPSVGKGKVTLVHSKMEDPEIAELDEDFDPEQARKELQISEFLARGSQPCVMANVGMLTTGFDDPKILTIFLARLTFSKNLFWQMIGRGTRGPVAGGTSYCNVIDPIRLTDKFEVFNGYRPDLAKGGIPVTDLEGAHPEVEDTEITPPTVDIPPPPDPDVGMDPRIVLAVQEALREFLRGGIFNVNELADAVEKVEIRQEELRPKLVPRESESNTPSVLAIFEGGIRALEKAWGVELPWLRSEIPTTLNE